MIKYPAGLYGFQALFRLHGSAAFKSLPPATVSTAFYILIYYTTDLQDLDPRVFDHPYVLGALMVAFSFMLTFKLSFSYNRYWEACSSVHQMHSKWMDVAMELAAFHLQSNHYEKPPAFGEHPEVKSLTRERLRANALTREEMEERIDAMIDEADEKKTRNRFQQAVYNVRRRRKKKQALKRAESVELSARMTDQNDAKSINTSKSVKRMPIIHSNLYESKIQQVSRGHGHGGKKSPNFQPPLFLQETAHLMSLMSAVAMSTLRGDLEEAESPLTTFHSDQPWPHVDPDDYSADVRRDWALSTHRTWTVIGYLLGSTRNKRGQTLYNAARPFRVIGGVSDAEVELLQAARGPQAKVALAHYWVAEYIIREHHAGSTGGVAHPIISRLFQFASDGMLGYNHARKVATIPFPFPHTQITTLYIGVVLFYIPILMLTFVSNFWFGAALNFLTVSCFSGLHEVARELEDPFQNVPNDLPLNNFQAQFNEALMTMFAGYHPDAFWKVALVKTYPPTKPTLPKTKPSDDSGDKKNPTVKFADVVKHAMNQTTSVMGMTAGSIVEESEAEPDDDDEEEEDDGEGETHIAVVSADPEPMDDEDNYEDDEDEDEEAEQKKKKKHHQRSSSIAQIVADIPLEELELHMKAQEESRAHPLRE